MKACDIIEPYFSSIGLNLKSGDARSMMPLSVFCLHDYIYTTFNKDIRGLNLKHEGKKIKNDWDRENAIHFGRFFKTLDEDRRNTIIDIMDDFDEYLGNSIDLIRFCIMDCVNDVSIECQKILASLQICNILSQVAQNIWVSMIRTAPMLSSKMRYNEVVRKYSALLSDGIYAAAGGKSINKKYEDKLISCIQAFSNKLFDWMNDRSINGIKV